MAGSKKKKSLTKTRSDDTTTGTEIITIMYGVIHRLYFVHCRVPYRRHTRNFVETRRQYQNIVPTCRRRRRRRCFIKLLF